MQFKRAATLTILLGLVPFFSAALTLDEIKAKLLGILERVSVLNVELEKAATLKVGEHPTLPCLSLGRNLRTGMEGEDVQRLQELLIKAGMLAEGKATGYFGPLTEAAVKKWQTEQGIVSSGSAATSGYGVVGPKTRAAILTLCKEKVQAGRTPRSCPAEPAAPAAGECIGTWQKGYDASGCLTGYQCLGLSTPPPSTPATAATTSLTILSPTLGSLVTGGNTLTISWQSRNAPAYGTVSLALLDASGNVVGVIARALASSGVYRWTVPSGSTDCSSGENAFTCIEKFARCDGSSSICTLPPGTYTIRASLSTIESLSEPFQIAGTAVMDALQSAVGAPVLPPPAPDYSISGQISVFGSCVHDGRSYEEGVTLSVPCEAGKCPSETSGYISGTCKTGRWCIPQTSNCAAAFADIDVSAYSGSGGSSSQSGTSVACPAEGWRAYLACPYGGCTTGWNICRGGVWILDSVQQTVIVGMQGPCEAGQVWCGVGTGFGCVATSMCVNGSAL